MSSVCEEVGWGGEESDMPIAACVCEGKKRANDTLAVRNKQSLSKSAKFLPVEERQRGGGRFCGIAGRPTLARKRDSQ